MLQLSKYNEVIENGFAETAPHKICQYIYELANAFNSFYHDTKILSEEDQCSKGQLHRPDHTDQKNAGDLHRTSGRSRLRSGCKRKG